jgi:hypothetical protein
MRRPRLLKWLQWLESERYQAREDPCPLRMMPRSGTGIGPRTVSLWKVPSRTQIIVRSPRLMPELSRLLPPCRSVGSSHRKGRD